MYEMVTGRVPFDGDNTVAIALAAPGGCCGAAQCLQSGDSNES